MSDELGPCCSADGLPPDHVDGPQGTGEPTCRGSIPRDWREPLDEKSARAIALQVIAEENAEVDGDLEIVGTAHRSMDGSYSFAAVSPGSDLDSCFIVVHPDGSTEATPIPPA